MKAQENAVILAHNYQIPEVQDAADFVGDSLDLARRAAATDAAVIVFCGVHFMAETAAILSPDKKVVMPERSAGCPMADMITAPQLRELKKEHKDGIVVTYVNSSAAVKAETDWCCTSANAAEVVRATGAAKIIFVPDKYLGSYIAARVPDKEYVFWNGFCPTHARMTAEDIAERRAEHPGAVVMVHPECRPEVSEAADAVLSTGGMLKFVRETDASEIIVGTETGIIYRLKKENPDKIFYPLRADAVCPNMKKTDLGNVLSALESSAAGDPARVIQVRGDIAARARRSIDRMLSV